MSGQIVAYARVSSVEQHLDRQRAAISDAVSVHRWFEDKASGGSTDRPALAALLAHVREGDEVVVASMDRLARSVPDLFGLVDGLVARGVSVRFLKEGQVYEPGPSSGMSRLMLGILGSVAEFERDLIRARQAEGIAQAKRRGVYRGSTPRLGPDQIEEARTKVEAGVPVARVAREMRVSRQTLYDALGGKGAYGDMREVSVTPARLRRSR